MSVNNILKSFSSFFNIGNNKSDNNLNQGKEFLSYENVYKNMVQPHLEPIQTTTSPNLSSLVETLESESSLKDKKHVDHHDMSNIEKEFNKKLAEYTATYKSFMENIINNTEDKNISIKYHGKVVKDKDGNFIYINNYGFTHKYLSDSWSYNDSSCPDAVTAIENNILNKFKTGPNMGSGQACKIAGQNIENNQTKEIAWVDIKGFKHVYPQELWKNKKESCNIEPIKLSSKAYDNIQNGPPMEQNTDCLKINVDPLLWSKLQKLNNELISLSETMLNELNNLKTTNNSNLEIENKINKLNNNIKQLSHNKDNITSIQGQQEFSSNYATANQYQKNIWLILAILLLLGLFRSLSGTDDTIIGSILIIVLIFVLYFVMKTYYN